MFKSSKVTVQTFITSQNINPIILKLSFLIIDDSFKYPNRVFKTESSIYTCYNCRYDGSRTALLDWITL